MKRKSIVTKKPTVCCNYYLEYKEIGNSDYKADRARCVQCKSVFEIKSGSELVYFQKKGEGNFIHLGCGNTVMVAEIIHSLWDSRFDCAGSGETQKNPVPYCPEHEKKPDWQGIPIYY